MAVTINYPADSPHIVVTLTGKLSKEDYERFVPEIESLLRKHGKLDILVLMSDFHGWEPGGLWEDIKFDAKHRSDVGRVAFVGDRTWEEWMAKICNPFTSAEVRYFDAGEREAAEAWMQQQTPVSSKS